MQQLIKNDNVVMDRVKLPFYFDVDRMVDEIKSIELNTFEYYDVIPLRAPAHLVDATRSVPSSGGNFADGSWTDWLDTKLLESSPYLMSIVETFRKYTTVNLVRLLRLAPHSTVKEHTDPTLALEEKDSVIRLTIPIIKSEKVSFFLNNTIVPMQPGECWYLKLNDPHKIINQGDEERINLTIDMIPNDWIRRIIELTKRKIEDKNR